MTPETAIVLSFFAGLFLIGSAIWYFLPAKTKAWLTVAWEFVKSLKNKP